MNLRPIAMLLALASLTTAAFAVRPAVDFFLQPGGGSSNLPVTTSFRFTDDPLLNYVNGSYAAGSYSSEASFNLANGGSAGLSFYSGDPSWTPYGSFVLNDNGTFTFSITEEAMTRIIYDDSGFIFTLSGLVTQPGTMISGFSVNSTNPFYEALTFDFDGNAGTVTVSYGQAAGNLPASPYSLLGTFTSSPIPEPATLALGFAAITGAFVAWRRRKPAAT